MTRKPAGAHSDSMMGEKRVLAKLKAGVCGEGLMISVRTGRWVIGMIVKWQGSGRAFYQLFLCSTTSLAREPQIVHVQRRERPTQQDAKVDSDKNYAKARTLVVNAR
jgi:hypothetical protein